MGKPIDDHNKPNPKEKPQPQPTTQNHPPTMGQENSKVPQTNGPPGQSGYQGAPSESPDNAGQGNKEPKKSSNYQTLSVSPQADPTQTEETPQSGYDNGLKPVDSLSDNKENMNLSGYPPPTVPRPQGAPVASDINGTMAAQQEPKSQVQTKQLTGPTQTEETPQSGYCGGPKPVDSPSDNMNLSGYVGSESAADSGPKPKPAAAGNIVNEAKGLQPTGAGNVEEAAAAAQTTGAGQVDEAEGSQRTGEAHDDAKPKNDKKKKK